MFFIVIYYTFKDSSYAVIGISLINTSLIGIATDLTGNILVKKDLILKEETISHLSNLISSLNEELCTQNRELLGISIGVPHNKESSLHYQPLPLLNSSIISTLEKTFRIKVFIQPNSTLKTIAEHRVGGAREHSCFTHASFGEIIFIQHMYKDSLIPKETRILNHLSIDPHGPLCSCGNRGCLGLYASLSDLVEHIEATTSSSSQKEVLKEIADIIAIALFNSIMFSGIPHIVVGGELFKRYPTLFTLVEQAVLKRTTPLKIKPTTITKSPLSEDASAQGGALYVADLALLNQNSLFFHTLHNDLPFKSHEG